MHGPRLTQTTSMSSSLLMAQPSTQRLLGWSLIWQMEVLALDLRGLLSWLKTSRWRLQTLKLEENSLSPALRTSSRLFEFEPLSFVFRVLPLFPLSLLSNFEFTTWALSSFSVSTILLLLLIGNMYEFSSLWNIVQGLRYCKEEKVRTWICSLRNLNKDANGAQSSKTRYTNNLNSLTPNPLANQNRNLNLSSDISKRNIDLKS